jgi:hypothetical protein
MSEPMHIISLGAGVQSSVMAMMAACGEIGPMPKAAVFADTGAEPDSVYRWLEWLETQLPFPVIRVMQDEGLIPAALTVRTSGKTGNTYLKTGLPVFYYPSTGIGSRQCTRDFKITPVNREIKRLAGGAEVFSWIGISTDEQVYRKKPSRDPKIEHRWPLLEKEMSRRDCLKWMVDRDLPKPPRSACYFCPYKSDNEWRRLRNEEPLEWQKAIDFEWQLQQRAIKATAIKGTPFLHKSCVPLGEVDLRTPKEKGQEDLFDERFDSQFNNECEGMCGV